MKYYTIFRIWNIEQPYATLELSGQGRFLKKNGNFDICTLNNQDFNGLVSLRCCTVKSSMSYLVGTYISPEHPL